MAVGREAGRVGVQRRRREGQRHQHQVLHQHQHKEAGVRDEGELTPARAGHLLVDVDHDDGGGEAADDKLEHVHQLEPALGRAALH